MEKGMKKGFALAAVALLALLIAGIAFAASQPALLPGCSIAPAFRLEKDNMTVVSGRAATIKMYLTGAQPSYCGSQVYGVDFTNGYDGGMFSLGLEGITGVNTVALTNGETHEFVGELSPLPSTPAGDYSIQVTAYLDSDHWKQESKNVAVTVKQQPDSDTYWKSSLDIGWNLIPYEEGSTAYGCDNITDAYRYSPSANDYVEMKRFGPVIEQADGQMVPGNERFSGLFVFSRERCTMETRVPADAFLDAQVAMKGGQLLSVPPSWQGATAISITELCGKQGSGNTAVSRWDAAEQKWLNVPDGEPLANGEVLKIKPAKQCVLDLGAEFQ